MAFTKLWSVYKQRTGNQFEDSDDTFFGIINEEGNLTNAGHYWQMNLLYVIQDCFTRWNGLDRALEVIDAIDTHEYSGGLIKYSLSR